VTVLYKGLNAGHPYSKGYQSGSGTHRFRELVGWKEDVAQTDGFPSTSQLSISAPLLMFLAARVVKGILRAG